MSSEAGCLGKLVRVISPVADVDQVIRDVLLELGTLIPAEASLMTATTMAPGGPGKYRTFGNLRWYLARRIRTQWCPRCRLLRRQRRAWTTGHCRW